METYHLATTHDLKFRTWTAGNMAEEDLTLDLWSTARSQVLESLEYNSCAGGVNLDYVLNYEGAKYYEKELDTKPVPGAPQWPDGRPKLETRIKPNFKTRVASTKAYALGQHIALFPGEDFADINKALAIVPQRNLILTYLKEGVCRGFMLAVFSGHDTQNELNGDLYDELYEGIYVDVICSSGSGAGKRMFTLLRSVYDVDLTLKATPDAMLYYPTKLAEVIPPFSFGTCNKKLNPKVHAEIVKILADDPNKLSPYNDKYATLSPARKEALKLIFKHNLANDQNSIEMRWARTYKNKKGSAVNEPACPYTMPAEKGKAEVEITDEEAKFMFEKNCLMNGTKMSSCLTRKKRPSVVTVLPDVELPPPQEEKSKPPPQEEKSKPPPQVKKSKPPPQEEKSKPPKTKKEKVVNLKAFNRVKSEFKALTNRHFDSDSTEADFRRVIPDATDSEIARAYAMFRSTRKPRVKAAKPLKTKKPKNLHPNDTAEIMVNGETHKVKILSVHGDKCLIHYEGWNKRHDTEVDIEDLFV